MIAAVSENAIAAQTANVIAAKTANVIAAKTANAVVIAIAVMDTSGLYNVCISPVYTRHSRNLSDSAKSSI